MRIPDDVYKRCTLLAKSYPALIKRRTEIEKEILFGSPVRDEGMPSGSGVGHPTEDKAIRLAMRKELNETRIKAVQDALEMLEPFEQELIRLNLFKRIPMEVCNVPMSIRRMKMIRKRFIIMIAENLHEI